MLPLNLGNGHAKLRVLCLGAHSDDIEIGCAGTLLRWAREYDSIEVTWAVLSASGERGREARRSANNLLRGASSRELVLGDFEDAHMAADFRRVKGFLGELRRRNEVDVVMTHCLEDRHQDHRLVAEMTWQTWRDHLILEYEIPKYEGDLGQPNVFAPIPGPLVERKLRHLARHFGSQRSKDWFHDATFRALMHLRGVECRSPSGFAEAFHCRKSVI